MESNIIYHINQIKDESTRRAIQAVFDYLLDTRITLTGYVYDGDPDTDGSWRSYVNDAGNKVYEKRESGSWVKKGSWTA